MVMESQGGGGENFRWTDFGKVDGDVAASTADVDDFALAEFGPVVPVAELGELAVHCWISQYYGLLSATSL